MYCGRVLLILALVAAPSVAQSSYVLEFSNGQLVPAKSVEGLASSVGEASAGGSGQAPVGRPRAQEGPSGRAGDARAGGLYFGSCAEAARAGYSSMLIGTPGYREGLDGDSDGVACEPYRGRP
jgi:hypothetical protein